MKFIWVFLIIVILVNVTRAKNLLYIFLENRNINSDVSKVTKPPKYILTNRRTIGLFPRLPNSGNKFMVDLKPPVKTYSQATQTELNKKLLMRKLSIEYINYKDNDNLKAEVTTRRSLMKVMKFTVKPHDIYAESIREKYNWNNNRKINTYKSRMPKSERNIPKTNSKIGKDESRFLNIKNVDMSLYDNNYHLSGKQNNKNSFVALGTLEPKIRPPFPKRYNTKYFKGNPKQRVSNRLQINNFVSESKVPSIVVNNVKSGIIIEEKENKRVSSNVFIKSDSKDQMNEMIETNENFFGQDEFIPVNEVNENTFVESDFTNDVEMTADSDVEYLVSRPKRGVNIIEEESIATTFSVMKFTNQDYPLSHDLTFKNIHT